MNTLLPVLVGAIISIMITMNGVLAEGIGPYTASVIIHFIGLIVITSILIATKSKITFKKEIPLFLYSAGMIGVFTVLFNNITIGAVGVSITLSLGLLGQSITSAFIDHFGWMNTKIIRFKKEKLIVIGIISLGIFIMNL